MTGGERRVLGEALPSRELWALAALVAVAAALRFTALDAQSFWLDEAFTFLTVDNDLGGMLEAIPDSESTPPLYYVLAWLWSRVLGTGEAGLRSLSALIGTLTVPVAYLAARRLLSPAAGLVTAGLVAASPFMVWYSQEARAYALVILLSALSVYLAARATEDGARAWLVAWALAAAGAIASHYFAILLVAAEVVWLLRTPASARGARAAVAVVAAVGLALVPLALAQRSNQGASGFDEAALSGRLADVPKEFLLGENGGPVRGLGPLCAALVGLALVLLVARATPEERRRALVPAALGSATLGLALAASVVGADYLTARHLSIAWVPLFLVVAAGMTLARARRPGLALAVGLAVAFAAITISIPSEPRLQRDDWRGAAASIGKPDGPRAILVSPAVGFVPLSLYEPGTEAVPGERFAVQEVDLIVMTRAGERLPPSPPLPGFRPLRVEHHATYASARYVADRPRPVTRRQLTSIRLTAEATGVVYQQP